MLAAALESAAETSFLEVGVAYVRFARDHPGHFVVMFTPEELDEDDAELAAARSRTFAVLQNGVSALAAGGRADDARAAVVAAWSLVHGFASLWLHGSLPVELNQDPEEAARLVAGVLFRT